MAALFSTIEGLKLKNQWLANEQALYEDNEEVNTWANREINRANGPNLAYNQEYTNVMKLAEKEKKRQ